MHPVSIIQLKIIRYAKKQESVAVIKRKFSLHRKDSERIVMVDITDKDIKRLL